MATREYIGARYVPKFYQNSVDGSTQWQSNVVYEPLTWVTLQNSHMYISKKQVPATVGTPAENVDYWLDIGSYNGIIQDLDDRLDVVEDDVEHIQTRMKKKFIFFGDSYAVGFLPGGDEVHADTTGFYDRVISRLGLTADDYIEVKYGRAGFCSLGTNGKTWIQDLNDLTSDEDVTDIYVMGGCNDIGYITNSAVYTAIGTFIATAKTKFPNAKIKIGFCGRQSVTTVFNPNELLACVYQYKRGALDSGAGYLKGSENILKGQHGAMASDNYHPSDTGQSMLADYVLNDILGLDGYIKSGEYTVLPLTYDQAATSGISLCYFESEDCITIANIAPTQIHGNFSGNIVSGTQIPMATINSDCFAGIIGGTCSGFGQVMILSDLPAFLAGCAISIDNKTLNFRMVGLDANGQNPVPTRYDAIYLEPFSFTIPKIQLC